MDCHGKRRRFPQLPTGFGEGASPQSHNFDDELAHLVRAIKQPRVPEAIYDTDCKKGYCQKPPASCCGSRKYPSYIALASL
tara:strand:+ start:654 stop:896 length:243 start_codon:yes stop_codon:yes gene_type:complete